jgi:hypothetical protein
MVCYHEPVTIVSEDEYGRLGSEEHKRLTECQIIVKCRELSGRGWEPQEIQVGESQETLFLKWWED